MNLPAATERYITWLQQTIPEHLPVIVPVSGGSDSALCFWLLNAALPGRVRGIYCGDELRCGDWFDGIGTVEHTPIEINGHNPEVARWAYFLERALRDNAVLIGSHTKTERLLGTYSNASRAAMVQPLGETWKSDCIDLCRVVGITEEIIASSKRPDAACGRPEAYAALEFSEIDDFLRLKIGEQPLSEVSSKTQAYLEEIYTSSAAKRHFPLLGPA